MLPYTLRPYIKDDFEFVYQTKKAAYQRYVEKLWGAWDEQKQRSFFADFIKNFQNSLLIIESENAPIGIYHGNMIDENTYEIGNIIIVPQYQRNGIGQHILQDIIKQHSKCKIQLQVFKDNPAINLYKRLNFDVVDETKTHYIMERG